MGCFTQNPLTSILPLWQRQLSFHSVPCSTRPGVYPSLHPTQTFLKSISRNGIVNGKDVLLSFRLNRMSVNVSGQEGSHVTPFLRDFFFSCLPFIIVWKVFGKVSSQYVACLFHSGILFSNIYFLVHRLRGIRCLACWGPTQRHRPEQ